MQWLTGTDGQSLLSLFRANALDVRLREDSLNAYEAQCSVARIDWHATRRTAELCINVAYLEGTALAAEAERRGLTLSLSTDAIERFRTALPTILSTVRSERFCGEEGRWEQRFVRANALGTPWLALDRQVALPRHEGLRADLLAVSSQRSERALLVVEVKRELDNRIQHVAGQTAKYVAMLDPDERGLREDVANAYRRCCEQLRLLDFPAPDPDLIAPGMPVLGLVALADYNPKSELLRRAQEHAKTLGRPVRFTLVDENKLVLPVPNQWFA